MEDPLRFGTQRWSFFQSALFLGYIYTHAVANRTIKTSVLIQSVAVAIPFVVLPIAVRGHIDITQIVTHPATTVLEIAAFSIGLPFFLLSTSAPLLQRWFSNTAHHNASDPYFLYAASNAGSLVGLALYPFAFEPTLRIHQQIHIWSVGYGVFAFLTLACGGAAYQLQAEPYRVLPIPEVETSSRLFHKLLWAALAFVPGSLLYACTAQLSTDFPPVPMLWVIPLGLYLLSFIVAFSTPSAIIARSGRLLPVAVVASMVIFMMGLSFRGSAWIAMGLIKLFCFFVIALAFHAELARRRPDRQQLTEYYLWISAGGILGGILNQFLAPAAFSDFWEYPLTLIVAAALFPAISIVRRRPVRQWFVVSAVSAVGVAGIVMRLLGPRISPVVKMPVLALGAFVCLTVPVRWIAVCLLVILSCIGRIQPRPLYEARSFFGRYRVTAPRGGEWHILMHGTTMHGLQYVGKTPLELLPRGYYMPVKIVFDKILADKPSARIGAVGLGAGMISCYLSPNQSIRFFEIDPLVKQIANRYFSFMSQCPGRKDVVLGDARLTMRDTAPDSLNIIVLDAFSSDAIPVHLLTKEAFAMYREKLTSDGILLAHISNNYLDLVPVLVGSGAADGHSVLLLDDTHFSHDEAARGRLPSRWIAIVPSNVVPQFEAIGWKVLAISGVTWTDDYSSIFSVLPIRNLLK